MDNHIGIMPKPSNREKILTEGLRVVHARGFGGASVRDIVEAAGVPQGSFSNHFASKEARWIYDKIAIARNQGLDAGPHGTLPPSFPVFSKRPSPIPHAISLACPQFQIQV